MPVRGISYELYSTFKIHAISMYMKLQTIHNNYKLYQTQHFITLIESKG